MKFRTEIPPGRHQGLVSHDAPLMLLGSCFSDNIGNALADRGFHTIINPSGALYNPLSILSAAQRIVSGSPYSESELISREGRFISLMHHSRFAADTAEEALSNMNSELMMAHCALPQCKVIFITLGSTRLFRHKDSGKVVANCHKIPAREFTEETLTVAETAEALADTVDTLRNASPEAVIVFTVSPIRHLAYGLEGNSLSKATLRVAIEEVMARRSDILYFPAYEIMLDDLRDYRFYAPDMKHPSPVAVDYIYELFADTFFTTATKEQAERSLRETLRSRHRPLC